MTHESSLQIFPNDWFAKEASKHLVTNIMHGYFVAKEINSSH